MDNIRQAPILLPQIFDSKIWFGLNEHVPHFEYNWNEQIGILFEVEGLLLILVVQLPYKVDQLLIIKPQYNLVAGVNGVQHQV